MSGKTMTRLLTRKEAAGRLGMSETWVKSQIRAGRLTCVRLGRVVRIDERDLEDFIEQHKTPVGRIEGTLCNQAQSAGDGQAVELTERTVGTR